MDEICIHNLRHHCIIGVLKSERVEPQWLSCDLRIYLDTRPCAKSGRLGDTADYSLIKQATEFILVNGRFRLLETAADALASYILTFSNPHLAQAKVTLTKENVFADDSFPSLTIHRNASEYTCDWEEERGCYTQLMHRSGDLCLERVLVPPMGVYRRSKSSVAELIQTPGIELNGDHQEQLADAKKEMYQDHFHNTGTKSAALLRISHGQTH